MREADTVEIARRMVRLHGLRAQAIALERTEEVRLTGDSQALDRWQAVYAAICDQRRGPRASAGLGAEEATRSA